MVCRTSGVVLIVVFAFGSAVDGGFGKDVDGICDDEEEIQNDATLQKQVEERHSESKVMQLLNIFTQFEWLLLNGTVAALAIVLKKIVIFELFSDLGSLSVSLSHLPVSGGSEGVKFLGFLHHGIRLDRVGNQFTNYYILISFACQRFKQNQQFIINLAQMKTSLVILVVLLMACPAFCDFLPHRLRVVDFNKTSRNYFVRGNVPINKNKEFQIEELRGNLSQITNLNRYKLIVISLLNFLTAKETKLRYIEENFFEKNKKVAEYRNRVVLGSLLDPTKMPSWAAYALNKVGNYLDFDQIDELLEEIHNQIHKKGNKNTIVYVHCQAGVDRTAYVAGSYRMKYLNKSLQEVMKENMEVLKGHRQYMISQPQNGLQWFCFSLGRSQKECQVNY